MSKYSTKMISQDGITTSGFADPNTSGQWYFDRPGLSNMSIDVESVWDDYTGAGVKVGVMDTQVKFEHLDIVKAYDQDLDLDLASGNTELDWDTASYQNYHGTAVSGVIAAERGNNYGGQGIADGVTLVGLAMDFTFSDTQGMINRGFDAARTVDVVNCSWGFTTAFADRPTAGTAAGNALIGAVSEGRDGLGTVIVFSGGNNGSTQSSNYHGYQNSPFTIAVAAVDKDGEVAAFSSIGSNLLLSAAGVDILTSSTGSAVTTTSGTSFAAPMVTAAVALMLEANPNLGYRDVQQILALSARADELGTDARMGLGWVENGATTFNGGGMHYSDSYGYGYLNVHDAVRLAETWQTQSTYANLATQTTTAKFSDVVMTAGVTDTISVDFEVTSDILLEQATISMDFLWNHSNDLEVYLTSPDGTVSQLVYDFDKVGGGGVFRNFVFTTEALRGENAQGTWTLEIVNKNPEALTLNKLAAMSAALKSLTFTAYGSEANNNDVFIFNDEYWNGYYDGDTARQQLADTDGGIDTLNASMVTKSVVIDLTGATLSSIGGVALAIAANVIENVYSGDAADSLTGSAADNVISAGRGDDTVFGSAGNDRLDGGAGTDMLIFKIASSFVTAIQSLGAFSISLGWSMGGASGVSVISNFETFKFSDATFDLAGLLALDTNEAPVIEEETDTVTDTPDATPVDDPVTPEPVDETPTTDPVSTPPGTDPLQSPTGLNQIDGTAADDKIQGTRDADLIKGGAGADSVIGGAGDDYLVGETGDDTLLGGAGDDTLLGGAGDDLLIGAVGNDIMFGGDGADRLFGGDGDDSLVGGAGDDKLYGGLGHDTLIGGDGDDILSSNGGVTTLDGGLGNDKYFLGDDVDTLILHAERGVMNRIFNFDAQQDHLEVLLAEGTSGDLVYKETAGGTYLGLDDGETIEYFAFFTQTTATYLADALGL